MGKSREINQDMRKRIVDLHKCGSSLSAISRCLKHPSFLLIVNRLSLENSRASLSSTNAPWLLQSGQVCLVNTDPVIVPLHEQHRPDFIFMDNNAQAHRDPIIREQLLETGIPQWPALSPDLNPIENLDEIS
ncbi:hypothetical protein QQF64_023904 [Cirrhinus molitorella]|uniref:Sleeping Beauty transposase HTH domain-containing protein n=1 Tax=Cirrhinus molitorella TaxID=172907 RepID=A0ABR3NKB5_9TELE